MRKTRRVPRIAVVPQAALWVASTLGLMMAFAYPTRSVAQEAPGTAKPLAEVSVGATHIDWIPAADYERLSLMVAGPGDFYLRQEAKSGRAPSVDLFDSQGNRLLDGIYAWELRASPRLDNATREAVTRAREVGNEGAIEALKRSGKLLQRPLVQSGNFFVKSGGFAAVVPPKSSSPPAPLHNIAGKDLSENGNLVVKGNACIGSLCSLTSPTDVSFPVLRLKATDVNILFDDQDIPEGDGGSFRKWALQINPLGADQFGIKDVDGGSTPFKVAGGAPDSSLSVASNGNLGLGTSTPAQDIHVISGSSPAVRLEQDGSGALTPRAWDLAGNEVGFSIKDVTNSSAVPFRVRAGAPTSSVEIAANGSVGLGTASPAAALDVSRSAGALTTLARFANNSGIQVLYDRTDTGANDWQTSNFNQTFQISIPGSTTPQFSLNSNGNLTIGGTQYLTGSSRELKENFVPVDGVKILQRLAEMPLTAWNAKEDPTQRHIGPVAEDWWATFGLGPDDKHVSMTDIGGVALAAIKGLNAELKDRDRKIAELQERIETLERLLQPQPKFKSK